jgi:hypothetical protein
MRLQCLRCMGRMVGEKRHFSEEKRRLSWRSLILSVIGMALGASRPARRQGSVLLAGRSAKAW